VAKGDDDDGVAELLEAIADARSRASLAYEFSGGNGYAYAAMQACDKVARLAGVSRNAGVAGPQKQRGRQR
jgi:hypothetical protein